MNNTNWIARLHFGSGYIELASDLVWRPSESTPSLEILAQFANEESNPPSYRYSPADGWPGYYIARKLAKTLNADRAEYSPLPPTDPSVIY